MSTKNIVLVSSIFPPKGGGASIYYDQLIQILKESKEYKPICISEYDPEKQVRYYNDTAIHQICSDDTRVIKEYGTVPQYIDNEIGIEPDIYHIHPHTIGVETIHRGVAAGESAFVYEARGPSLIKRNMNYGLNKAYLSINKQIDQVLYDMSLDISDDQIFRSPVAVDSSHNCTAPKIDYTNKTRCIFVGGIHNHKGPHIAIEAVNQLTNTELIIIGDGPISNKIQELSDNTDDVYYLGELDHETTLCEIHNSDIIVCPFSTEGEPRVIYEALSLNVPVVASPAGNIKQMVDNKGIVTQRNVESIASAINELQENYTKYKSNIESNKLEGHNIDDVREGVFDAYEYVL